LTVKQTLKVPEDFFDFEEDRKYAGEYVLERLKGWEKLEVDKECREFDLDSQTVTIDDSKWKLKILEKTLAKPKKSLDELKKFPPGLLDFLIEQAVLLNTISQKQRDFLFSQLSTTSPQSKR